ncbi:MAG: hypothetical protein CMC71_00715 [Flavobacteriaceae bacterium]|nr:hypothetical protein [Flavobacteriaceae bacterium]
MDKFKTTRLYTAPYRLSKEREVSLYTSTNESFLDASKLKLKETRNMFIKKILSNFKAQINFFKYKINIDD